MEVTHQNQKIETERTAARSVLISFFERRFLEPWSALQSSTPQRSSKHLGALQKILFLFTTGLMTEQNVYSHTYKKGPHSAVKVRVRETNVYNNRKFILTLIFCLGLKIAYYNNKMKFFL